MGFYVSKPDDSIKDAIIVGYPIDETVKYETNPSIRGVFVNDILIKAKNNGICIDRKRRIIGFRPEFIFYYLMNYSQIHGYSNTIYSSDQLKQFDSNITSSSSCSAENIILYGVPGCGKSYYIKKHFCNDEDRIERVVFHPDYTYSDFVGQIMPQSDENNHISYPFIAGPFTRILQKANQEENKDTMFYLIIEEINRGNAPAIFGDIFQLLDRDGSGESTYGISNEDIAKYVYRNSDTKVRIPGNLTIIATMNTSDQNVFTLDTAFKRRWHMKHIANDIDSCKYSNKQICGQDITWNNFVTIINDIIADEGSGSVGYEDKRLGAYFATENELDNSELFADKILMYLWNDVFKYNQDRVFNAKYKTLDQLIEGFKKDYFKVFSNSVVFYNTTNNDTALDNQNLNLDSNVSSADTLIGE